MLKCDRSQSLIVLAESSHALVMNNVSSYEAWHSPWHCALFSGLHLVSISLFILRYLVTKSVKKGLVILLYLRYYYLSQILIKISAQITLWPLNLLKLYIIFILRRKEGRLHLNFHGLNISVHLFPLTVQWILTVEII